jgi:hypothetical protein
MWECGVFRVGHMHECPVGIYQPWCRSAALLATAFKRTTAACFGKHITEASRTCCQQLPARVCCHALDVLLVALIGLVGGHHILVSILPHKHLQERENTAADNKRSRTLLANCAGELLWSGELPVLCTLSLQHHLPFPRQHTCNVACLYTATLIT